MKEPMKNTYVQIAAMVTLVASLGLAWGCSGSGSERDADAGTDARNTAETSVDATLDTNDATTGGQGGSAGTDDGGTNTGGSNTGGANTGGASVGGAAGVGGTAGTGGEQVGGTGGASVCKPIPANTHPRLLLGAGEENEIKALITSDTTWKAVHDKVIAQADKVITEPVVVRELEGKRLLKVSRTFESRVIALAYAYRMTGDSKYLARAEKEMLAVVQFPDWNPSHFLDVAEMTLGMAVGFDWLYDKLSASTRKQITNAIIKKGLEPSKGQNYWWISATNNWNQVCHAGLTFGALAVQKDHPDLAKEMIDRAFEKIPLAMKAYEPDGVYPEGFGYWQYGTMFNLYFIRAMLKAECSARGLEKHQAFLKSAQFIMHMVSPTGNTFNWSDAGTSKTSLLPPLFWMANHTSNLSLLWNQKDLLTGRKYGAGPSTVDLLMYGRDVKLDQITEPKARMWVGQGKNAVALMRTSWKDPAGLFLGLKAGTPSANHGHMDVGSFVMDADGVRWASDPGSENYTIIEAQGIDIWNMKQDSGRWGLFRLGPLSHGVLTFDGQRQQVTGSAKIDKKSSDDAFMYAITDVSSIYNGQVASVKRGVAIKDAQYVVIRDEIKTLPKDHQTKVRWAIFTFAKVKVENKRAILTIDDKTLYLKVSGPGTIAMKTWSTKPTNTYESPNDGTTMVGFETTLPKSTSASFEVLLVPQKADAKATFVNKPLANW